MAETDRYFCKNCKLINFVAELPDVNLAFETVFSSMVLLS